MKLRAQIVVDLDVKTYVEAAEHQRHLEALLEHVKARYVTAELQIRERRDRKAHQAVDAQLGPRFAQMRSGRT